MDIWELLTQVNWNNLLSSLFGAGFGALAAYWLSCKKERNKVHVDERASLIKLLYDINISAKTLCCYYSNILSEIKHYSKKVQGYQIPISLELASIDLATYGFIAKKSPKLYEILTYLKEAIEFIIDENNILSQEMGALSKDYHAQLYDIQTLLPKAVAKAYVSLLNVNAFLIKYYDTDNLLKEHVLNAIRRMQKVLRITFKYYQLIISNKWKKGNVLDKHQIKIHKKGLKGELNYINEILRDWIIDFQLSKRQKAQINKLNIR